MKIRVPVMLYRLYDESDGLLYIGITENLGTRMDAHARCQPWWGQVSRLTVEMLPDRAAAEAAETAAIHAESPRHNKDKQFPVTPPFAEAVPLFDGEIKWANQRPMAQQIADDLRAQIMAGQIPDGAQLPSIPSFARDRGVSTSSVQSAWRILKEEGHLVAKAGAGVYARHQLLAGASSDNVPYLVEVAETEAPADVARALGVDRVVLRHEKTLQDGKPIELRWSYYPASIAAGTALAKYEELEQEVFAVLAELGYPRRKFTDRLLARAPTTKEVEVLGMASSIPVFRQFRTTYSDGGLPIEVSVLIKGGHLYEYSHRQVMPNPPPDWFAEYAC